MKKALNTSVTLDLLSIYIHVGVVGHLIGWNVKGGWGQNGQQVRRGKSTQPVPARIMWMQNKHLAPVVKTSVPTPNALPSVPPTLPVLAVCDLLGVGEQELHSGIKLLSSVRGPPFVTVSL